MNEYDLDIHHRRSIRLETYDYSTSGFYYVTVCTQDKRHLLGYIEEGKMYLSSSGEMVLKWVDELEKKYPDIAIPSFVIMPNHIHMIVEKENVDLEMRLVRNEHYRETGEHDSEDTGTVLFRVMQWFKTMSTNEYFRGVNAGKWERVRGKLWQRNYWEHVVRSYESLYHLDLYIRCNTVNWVKDKYYSVQATVPLYRLEE